MASGFDQLHFGYLFSGCGCANSFPLSNSYRISVPRVSPEFA